MGPLSNAERQARFKQRQKARADAFMALRNATEDDVAVALKGSYVADVCGNVEPAALLEFWNRMLDRFIGERDD
jgi:hypothetical protein